MKFLMINLFALGCLFLTPSSAHACPPEEVSLFEELKAELEKVTKLSFTKSIRKGRDACWNKRHVNAYLHQIEEAFHAVILVSKAIKGHGTNLEIVFHMNNGDRRDQKLKCNISDIPTIPGELFAKFQTVFYSDPADAIFKALGVL